MVTYCTVCNNNTRKKKDISYFNYPKESNRRHKWLKAVGREDLMPKIINDNTRQRYRICEDHFERSNIFFSKNKTKKYLYENAFPTLNLPSNDGAGSSQCETVSAQEMLPITEPCSSLNNVSYEIVLQDQSRSIQMDPNKQTNEIRTQTALHLSAGTPRKRKLTLAPREVRKHSDTCRTEYKFKVITKETEVEDPLANSDRQCRFCAKITNNCLDANDKPYVKDNKTTLILNDLNVEIVFNNGKPKVCLDCDKKLLEMFNFVKLVKNAQDALLNVSYDMEETETLVVKTERESPTPDDNELDHEDTKEGIVDSITIEETAFLKDNVFVHKKRKCDKDTEQRSKQKKPKVDDNKVYEHTQLIKDIKEEPVEMDDDANKVQTDRQKDRDTGPDVKPSELAIATSASLNDMTGHVYS